MKTLLSHGVFFLIAFVSAFSTCAQERYVVGLTNGQEVQASKVRLRTPAFSQPYIEADGERYAFHEVDYYKNENGFFQKLIPPRSREEEFFRREVDGPRINAYSRVVTQMTYGGGPGMAPTMQTQRLDYYVKDDGPTQMMTFSNLKKDLADHAGSQQMLRSVKSLRMVTGLLYVAGAAMVISGISSDLKTVKDGPSSDGGGIPPMFIGGAVTLAIPWLVFRPMKRKKMMQAVMVYNQ